MLFNTGSVIQMLPVLTCGTTINNDLVFGSLGVGSYTYYVQARAENNGQQTVQVMIEHTFTVGAAESHQTELALTSVGYNMTVNVGKGLAYDI